MMGLALIFINTLKITKKHCLRGSYDFSVSFALFTSKPHANLKVC